MKLFYLTTMFAVMATLSSAAEAGWLTGKCKPDGCCDGATCAPCQSTCCPTVKNVKVKNHCWETECKQICVPRVQCPSIFSFFCKDNCDPCAAGIFKGKSLAGRCADVKCVKALKKVEYECDDCVVEWKVQCASPGCGKCCDGYGIQDGCCVIK